MKSQKDYSFEINKNKTNPSKLADILVDIGSRVSYLSDVYVDLELKRAKWWGANGKDSEGKRRSDTKMEMKWILTEDGEKWFIVKKDLSACENARRTISKALDVRANEAFSQY